MWFNSMVDSAGGQILTANNKVVLSSAAEKAAAIMHELATSKGADPSLNVSQEGPGQVAFQSGTAAFMINYPFVWSATQAGNPKVVQEHGVRLLPAGHTRASRQRSRSAATTSASRPSPATPTWPSRRCSA